MRAYERFTRDAGKPIGWIFSIIMIILFVVWAVGLMCTPRTTEEKVLQDAKRAWNAECDRMGVGEVYDTERRKFSGQNYCVKITLIEDYPIFDESSWRRGCTERSGEWQYYNSAKACFKVEVIDSLGAREDIVR